MASRLELHEEFCSLLGNRHVYYQPPESVKIFYPAIIYEISGHPSVAADDTNYLIRNTYDVTLIYEDPDSTLPLRMLMWFPMVRHGKHYTSNNLIHDTFEIYW